MVKMVQYSAVIILTYFPDYFRLYLRTCCPVVLFATVIINRQALKLTKSLFGKFMMDNMDNISRLAVTETLLLASSGANNKQSAG